MATKPKTEQKESTCTHSYVVTAWQQGGGREKAIAMRCSSCLDYLDLQQLESQEFRERQGI